MKKKQQNKKQQDRQKAVFHSIWISQVKRHKDTIILDRVRYGSNGLSVLHQIKSIVFF